MKLVWPTSIAILAALPTVSAFAPVRPVGTSSFVASSHSYAPPRTVQSSTALQMNLFDRFFRVAKSNLNLVLNSLEDPEKILQQATTDMQSDLMKIRQSYSEVTAAQRRMAKQKQQADAVANDWYNRAQLALRKDNEGLAREALTRRQMALEQAETLQTQMDAQGKAIDKLYEGMQVLEQKIMEANTKKSQIEARAKTAKTTITVNDMLSGMTGKTSMDAFKRMEEKVEALESAAEVSAEMASVFGGKSDPSLEKEFARLEASSTVDDELKKMKGLLKSGKVESPALPGDARVEQELRELEDKVWKVPVREKVQ